MPARRPDVPRYAPSYRPWSSLSLPKLAWMAAAGAALAVGSIGVGGPEARPAAAPPAPLTAPPGQHDRVALEAPGSRGDAADTHTAQRLALPSAPTHGLDAHRPGASAGGLANRPAGAPGSGSGVGAGHAVDVPLIVQQALPAGATPIDHGDGVVTFGMPFRKGAVQESFGRPALAVEGSDTWQTQTLARWDDGSVQWALADARVDVPAGVQLESLRLVSGAGVSTPQNLAQQSGNAIRADTGELRVWIPTQIGNTPSPLVFVKPDSAALSSPAAPLWLVGGDLGGLPLGAGPGTQAKLVVNGPARTVVRIDGPVVNAVGDTVLDFSLRVTLRAGRSDLETSLTIRNASIQRQKHAQIDSLGLALVATLGADATAHIAGPDDPFAVDLTPAEFAYAYQAYSSASTIHTDSPEFLPHLPKQLGSQVDYVEEGYQVHAKGVDLQPLGDRDAYPEHTWLDVTGADAGVTVSIQRMAYMWPAALECTGGGLVVAGLFTARNPADYTFVWRQHESRTAVFDFHDGGLQTPSVTSMAAVAERLDHPLAARSSDYGHYDRAGVFPFRLLTVAEQEQAYAWMGIDHQIQVQNSSMTVMRYIGKSFTGGSNNYALIEDRLAGRWLRHGLGGHYLKALDYALWKSEWQIKRSDDFEYDPDLEPTNDHIPHTTRAFGDEEHRYREGIILAYWLTGDTRYRDALFDEAEVLRTVEHYQQERSMYQTLRAQALVGAFTQDPVLRSALGDRVDWFCTPIQDIHTDTDGWGWEAQPDAGSRRYYVNSADNKNEKPPGENYQTRGWITASLGPLGLYHAARALDPGDPSAALARGRMRDLSYWTRQELFPFEPDPVERRLPYSYAVTLMEWTITEIYDFHPILLGMAESYVDTGDLTYLKRGVQQLEAFAVHDNGPYANNLYLADTRLDCQHFFAVYRDWYLSQF